MCTGLELAGLAATVAGTGISMASSAKAQRAMNQQALSALAAQEGFQRQATPIQKQALQDVGAAQTQRRLSDVVQQTRPIYDQVAAGSQGRSVLPVDNVRANQVISQSRDAAAANSAYSDVALQNWIKQQRAGQQLGVISNLANSQASMAPVLTQLAGQKSANMAAVGSLLSTAGGLANIYAGVNARRAVPVGTVGQVAPAKSFGESKTYA